MCDALGVEIARTELLPAYVALTKDAEAEVRTAVAQKVTDICAIIPKEKIISDILPSIAALVTDKSEHVRGMNFF